MGRGTLANWEGALFHVTLHTVSRDIAVQDEEDWSALGTFVTRTLFWCGGRVHACRCEGGEMHFAIEVARVPIAAMCHRVSTGYSLHLCRRYGRRGRIFRPYRATQVDRALYLTDLVLWLHRKAGWRGESPSAQHRCWTGDDGYLSRGNLPWITTAMVLDELGRGAGAVQAYRQRKRQVLDPDVIAFLDPPLAHSGKASTNIVVERHSHAMTRQIRPLGQKGIEKLARLVATERGVSFDRMCSESRQREVSKARIITAVLAVRNGASLKAVARLFGLDSSSLLEEVEGRRIEEPEMFEKADKAVAPFLPFHCDNDSSLSTHHGITKCKLSTCP